MNGFENAWRKIEDCQKDKHRVICCVGPTGPTGRLFKSSNRIIIDSS